MLTLSCSVRAMRAGVEMPKSCWWLLKLANTSTISREWIALQHAHLMPFTDILISGECGMSWRIAHACEYAYTHVCVCCTPLHA